jgi:hypothetical protein
MISSVVGSVENMLMVLGLRGRIGWLGRRREILWRSQYLHFDLRVKRFHCSALGCTYNRMIWDEALELPQEAAWEDYFRDSTNLPFRIRGLWIMRVCTTILASSGWFPIRQMQQVLAMCYLIIWEEALPTGHLTNPGPKTPRY